MTETAEKIRVLLVGFTVADDVIKRICSVDYFMPVQTHKLSWSVVRGLEANGTAVDLLSAEPVGTYPKNPQILFRFAKWQRDDRSWNVLIPFVNLLAAKHLTRFVSCLFFVSLWLVKPRGTERRVIILHGVHSPFMYAVLLARKLFDFTAVTIVSDPPSVALPGEGVITGMLRKLDAWVIKSALRSMNGVVVLTRQLATAFAPGVPSVVIEGILYDRDHSGGSSSDCEGDRGDGGVFTILYAGGLQAEYGVDLLLKGFALTTDPSLRLLVLGKGDLVDEIKAAAGSDSRIVFKGYCQQHEVKNLMSKATVLINPRPSNQAFTQFSFPSKTIEYMASGRPVITTRLPGVPDEYWEHVIALEKETPEGVAELLLHLKSMPAQSLRNIGTAAKAFVLEHKNEKSQGRRLQKFLHELSEGARP